MSKFSKIVLALGSLFVFVQPAFAQVSVCPPGGLGYIACTIGLTPSTGLSDLIEVGINIILSAAALIAIYYLIMGGVKWIQSGGDKGAIDQSRQQILSATVGLVIVFSIFILVNVIGAIFGVQLLQFNIPTLSNPGG